MADTNKGTNVRDKAQDTAASARQTVQDAKSTLQEGAAAAGHKAQEFASNLGHKAQDTASTVAHRASDAASSVADKTEHALSSAGQSMSSLAGTIRQNAPREGYLGSAASTVADQLQSGGRYLQEHRLNDMAEDLGSLIRSYPIAAIGVAFGVGWLFGMASRR